MKQTTAPSATPSPQPGVSKPQHAVGRNDNLSSVFVGAVLDMSWRLALVVIVPIVGGTELDKFFKTSPVLLVAGLVLAVIGTVVVLWQSLQKANSLPVPKLTAAQRREVQKRYEEDDD